MNLYKAIFKPTGFKGSDWAKNRKDKQWGSKGHDPKPHPSFSEVRKICIDCKRNTQQDSETKRCRECLTRY